MGRGSLVKRGSVVVVELPPTLTHEQAGRRPCVVVSSEASVINARYDMLVIVPLTSTRLNGRLYQIIKLLRKPSVKGWYSAVYERDGRHRCSYKAPSRI